MKIDEQKLRIAEMSTDVLVFVFDMLFCLYIVSIIMEVR